MRIKRNVFIVSWLLLLALSCNQIETSKTLKQDDIDRLKGLKLLDEGEIVIKFYSEFRKNVAGNFFTDRRIATYWIDNRNAEKDKKDFAYYKDIARIDTVYNAGVTFSPYMLVTKTNGEHFKVSVNGKKEDIRSFFEDALQEWNHKKQ
ncbi:hypothetical protein [Chryseolinea lacunae]|uniref:Lipoprotein n=1 Tax=Chryseolinea lacunae TaxID=2801331 RepID=A0ABS1KTA5_9BACT|nr:hypothetical protein [Chryseolinea lacunae]MBL0742680.1 hypothetical protein [Chryseolinea lacunae]